MKVYDQHVHSFLSSDTNESFENYILKAQKLNLSHFVTTEHLDLASLHYNNNDDIFNLDKQDKLIEKFQKQYDIIFLKGVEMGYKAECLDKIEEIVANNNFDVVIMSVHECYKAKIDNPLLINDTAPDIAYAQYLNTCLHLLKHTSSFDILGHIDFLLRYIGKVEINKHKETFIEIFNLMVEKEKCLEFNTRFLYQYKNSFYLDYIFSLYYACKGRKVSLGSDAHSAYHFYSSFDHALKILYTIGFTYISTYQERKEKLVKI